MQKQSQYLFLFGSRRSNADQYNPLFAPNLDLMLECLPYVAANIRSTCDCRVNLVILLGEKT